MTVPGKRAHVAHLKKNLVIATVMKSRLLSYKCTTYLVMKARRCGVVALVFIRSCQPLLAKIRENID